MIENSAHYEIDPFHAHLYFRRDLLDTIYEEIKMQILEGNPDHLEFGQGIFMLEDISSNEGLMKLAVTANWRCDLETNSFVSLQVDSYCLYNGSLPDVLLDEIISLGPNIEWVYTQIDKEIEFR